MSLGIWPSYATHPTVLILNNWCLFIKLTRCLLLKTFDRKWFTWYLNDGSPGGRTVGRALPVPESSLQVGSKSLLEVIIEIWATSVLRRMSVFNIPGALRWLLRSELPLLLEECLHSVFQGPFAHRLSRPWCLFRFVFLLYGLYCLQELSPILWMMLL